jgi:hypothetical protein
MLESTLTTQNNIGIREAGKSHNVAPQNCREGLAEDTEKGQASVERATLNIVTITQMAENDPNLVEWDGPDDKNNPMNWSRRFRWLVTLTLGLMTFCVTFASSVFSCATVATAHLYHVSTEVTTLGTSLFVLVSNATLVPRMALVSNRTRLRSGSSGLGTLL